MNTILVVEDDPSMLLYYKEAFSNKYRILTASSGTNALAYNLETIDLALIDHNLPDISGVEVIKEMKRRRPSILIILITAYGDEDLAVRSFRAGTKDYVKKPFSYQELQKKIDFFLSLKTVSRDQRKIISFVEDPETSNRKFTDSNNFCKVQKAIKFISENYMTKIALGAVANRVAMSKFHFSREFKKTTGICYQDYLNQVRIEKAKELMRNQNMPVARVASFVGYNDLAHFGRIFKKVSGQNPAHYLRVMNEARASAMVCIPENNNPQKESPVG